MLGGSINKNDAFKKIISIGYELETASLAKFTKVTENTEGPLDDVLVNSDTSGPNLEEVIYYSVEQDGDELFNRKDELIKIDAYTTASLNQRTNSKSPKNIKGPNSQKNKNKKVPDKNVNFMIANDITSSPFSKHLNRLCLEGEEEEEDNEKLKENKNKLYTIELDGGVSYNLNFETLVPKECGLFADVEWIFTYYKPKRGDNLILDTFYNLSKNLILHLDSLQLQPCKLIIHLNEDDMDKDTVLVRKPEQRSLFHLPDTTLYYLQTQFVDELLITDDICVTPQMTFSVQIMDIMEVCKEIVAFKGLETEHLHKFKNVAHHQLESLEKIEKCIDKLFIEYNKKNPDEAFAEGNELVQTMKSYLFLILYKIFIFLNMYLKYRKEKPNMKFYLKDLLYFNSRHSNYDLYVELRKCISEYFSNRFGNETVHHIICKLVVQERILEQYFLKDAKSIRKKAFSPDKKYELDPTNHNYGNPEYSLLSYFQFFERPKTDKDNYDSGDDIMHDWFRYKNFDVFSTQMDIKKNIVLVEVRTFQRLLSSYLISLNDEVLLKTMTTGACNRIMGNNSPTISKFSIATLRRLVELYEMGSGKHRKNVTIKVKKEIKNRPISTTMNPRTRCANGSRKNKQRICIRI